MNNQGITICLKHNENIDLMDILNVIADAGKQSVWKISGVDSFGEAAEMLHKISDNQQVISGEDFYEIASNINQVLDGTFTAYKQNQENHWILIRSIRGDEFDVETKDENLLKIIRNTFNEVKDLIY